jgi:hypothetical protein
MDRPVTTSPASARDIILEIVRNMREGLEPLRYSTLAPSIFNVYLHPDDLDRLRGIVPRILDEARRALDSELETLNRAPLTERLKLGKLGKRSEPKIAPPDGGWQIRILENTDDETEPGDIVVHSELAMPPKPELGAGAMTKRISTRRLSGSATATYAAPIAAPAPQPPTPNPEPPYGPQPPENAVATIEYQDDSGRKTFHMMKDQIVVGRGGRDYWTDLKLETLPDVSREHFRLRRDPESGKFFLKDLSRLGTTINGESAPSSIEVVNGEKRDRNVEAPVPDQCRIGLAGVVFLEFRSTARSTSNG